MLALISGGGSALLAAPLPGISLDDKRALTKALLHSGAGISEMNCVRRHLSAIKGGRLALAAAPARVLTLAISDVPGDDLAAIASGPTVPDPSTLADAQAICARYGIAFPRQLPGDRPPARLVVGDRARANDGHDRRVSVLAPGAVVLAIEFVRVVRRVLHSDRLLARGQVAAVEIAGDRKAWVVCGVAARRLWDERLRLHHGRGGGGGRRRRRLR